MPALPILSLQSLSLLSDFILTESSTFHSSQVRVFWIILNTVSCQLEKEVKANQITHR